MSISNKLTKTKLSSHRKLQPERMLNGEVGSVGSVDIRISVCHELVIKRMNQCAASSVFLHTAQIKQSVWIITNLGELGRVSG